MKTLWKEGISGRRGLPRGKSDLQAGEDEKSVLFPSREAKANAQDLRQRRVALPHEITRPLLEVSAFVKLRRNGRGESGRGEKGGEGDGGGEAHVESPVSGV